MAIADAHYLPGATDPQQWLTDLVATLRTEPFTTTVIGVSIFCDGEFVARNDAPVHKVVAATVTDPSGLRVRDQHLFDEYLRWARDRLLPPVRAWTRVIVPNDRTTRSVVHLSTLRATTGPDAEPVYISYAWTKPNETQPRALRRDHWVLTDERDVIVAASRPSVGALGATRWMLAHPEDVVSSLAGWHRLAGGDLTVQVAPLRTITSSGWATGRIERRSIEAPNGPRFAASNRPSERTSTAIPEPVDVLSPRELEVFRSLLDGLAAVTIAQRLAIAPSTVRTITARILHKLKVADRDQLRDRYDPAAASAVEAAVLASRGFAEALPAARLARPVHLGADGTRDEWVDEIARSVASPLLSYTAVGVALLSEERIVAANRAFAGDVLPREGFEVGRVDPDDERRAWRAASAGARGLWSFTLHRGRREIVVSVVSRSETERAIALIYVTDVDAPPAPSAPAGWFLLDRHWRIRGVAAESGPLASAGRLHGITLWPLIHPAQLPSIVAGFAALHDGREDEVEIVHDTLRHGGWSSSRSQLRRVVTPDETLVLWELGPTLAPRRVAPAPEVVARVAPADRALAIAAIAATPIARLSADFDLAPGTVRNRLSRIYRALGVGSRRELVERFGSWR